MAHKIELVVPCVNRASFLRETLPLNTPKFDNVIVVTTPSDYETQHLCDEVGVRYLATDVFYKDGAPFNKGLAINKGLSQVKHEEWIVLADADILFLPAHVQLFRDSNLDKDALYGSYRAIIPDRAEYDTLAKTAAFNPDLLEVEKFVKSTPQELGVGFFQMFNMQGSVAQEIRETEIFITDEVFDVLVMPIIKDRNYPRLMKKKGHFYPYFPHAGGGDSQFRQFFIDKEKVIGISVPVIHLGDEGQDHAGKRPRAFC